MVNIIRHDSNSNLKFNLPTFHATTVKRAHIYVFVWKILRLPNVNQALQILRLEIMNNFQ